MMMFGDSFAFFCFVFRTCQKSHTISLRFDYFFSDNLLLFDYSLIEGKYNIAGKKDEKNARRNQ